MKIVMERVTGFFSKFGEKVVKDELTTMSASLSYYTALSLAPLIVLLLSFASLLGEGLQRNLVEQIGSLVGTQAAAAIKMIIDGADKRPDLRSFAGLLSVLTLGLSASAVFSELRTTMNKIFDVEPAPADNGGFMSTALTYVKSRAFTVAMVLTFVFLSIVSLVISSLVHVVLPSSDQTIGHMIDLGVSLGVYSSLFALIYRYVPNKRIPWSEAFKGALMTAALFVVGKKLIGVYLGEGAVGSAYGAAGSFIVLLVWVYYSSLIIFLGAEFSHLLVADKTTEKAPEKANGSEGLAQGTRDLPERRALGV